MIYGTGIDLANGPEKHVFSTGKGGTLTVSSESVGRAAMFLNCPSTASTPFSPKSKSVLSKGSPVTQQIQQGVRCLSRQATHSVSISRYVNTDQSYTGPIGPLTSNVSKEITGRIQHMMDPLLMTSVSGPLLSVDIEKPKIPKRSAD